MIKIVTKNMNQNFKAVIQSELLSVSSYLERLLYVLENQHALDSTAYNDLNLIINAFHFDIEDFFENEILKEEFIASKIERADISSLKEQVKMGTRLIESLLFFDFNVEKMQTICSTYINLLLDYGAKVHRFINRNLEVDVQYPRVNLIQFKAGEDEDTYEFHLPKSELVALDQDDVNITSISGQRDKKYQAFIIEGHTHLMDEEPAMAMSSFNKAYNLKETAEVLTLIGWTYFHMDEIEKAKSYALKAIKKDKDYGPPYNDMGTYILKEGFIDDSLKWFALAKEASDYQNREYPYINAGRAYMARKEFSKALNEFSMALTLAPFHDDLHQTVQKLKKRLAKAKMFDVEEAKEKEELNITPINFGETEPPDDDYPLF